MREEEKPARKSFDPYLYEGVTHLTISCNYHKINDKTNMTKRKNKGHDDKYQRHNESTH